jgi:hypothetical protein
MSSDPRNATEAAVALARSLSLPSGRGTVFAWHDDAGDRLVIAGDRHWLASNRAVPSEFMGFPVVVEEPFRGSAHAPRMVSVS